MFLEKNCELTIIPIIIGVLGSVLDEELSINIKLILVKVCPHETRYPAKKNKKQQMYDKIGYLLSKIRGYNEMVHNTFVYNKREECLFFNSNVSVLS